jgi:hypothetical protein
MKKKIESLCRLCMKSAVAAALISLIGFTNATAQNTKGEAVVATVTATATVTKINHKTREVHIKTTDGQVAKFVASADVQNLDQIKKGDMITVVYTEALAYEVKKHSTSAEGTTTTGAVANPGEKPAGAVAQQTTITVKITAINSKTASVTVKGTDGELETIKVKDPSKLNGLKVGDTVDITYIEAIAIKVDPKAK